MKKILSSIIFVMCALYAMDDQKKVDISPYIVCALRELQEKEVELKRRFRDEVKKEKESVPDYLGLFRACFLPECLECCKNPLLRHQFLDAIEDPLVRKAIALNWVGYEFKQGSLSMVGAPLFVQKYHLKKTIIEGKDIRRAFLPCLKNI